MENIPNFYHFMYKKDFFLSKTTFFSETNSPSTKWMVSFIRKAIQK